MTALSLQNSFHLIQKLDQWYILFKMDIEYTGENCRPFGLLTWTSFIDQFVHPFFLGGGEGNRKREGMGVVILAMYKFHFLE